MTLTLDRPVVQYAGYPLEGFDFDTSCGEGGPYVGPYRDARCWIPSPTAFTVRELTKLANDEQIKAAKTYPANVYQQVGARDAQRSSAPFLTALEPAIADNESLRRTFPRAQRSSTEGMANTGYRNPIGIWTALSWPAPDIANQIQDGIAADIAAAGGVATADQRLAWNAAEWLRFYGWIWLRHPKAWEDAPTLDLERYIKAVTIKMEELALPETIELANEMRRQLAESPDVLEEVIDEQLTEPAQKALKLAVFASVVLPFIFWLVPLLMRRDDA